MGQTAVVTKPPVATSAAAPEVIRGLRLAATVATYVAGFVAVVIWAAWLIPAVGRWLPNGWEIMTANTALCIALACVCSRLATDQLTPRQRWSRGIALALLLLVSGVNLVSSVARSPSLTEPFATMLPYPLEHRMAIQTALFFLSLGIALLPLQRTSRGAEVVQTITVAIPVAICLVVITGYAFDALHLTGESSVIRSSPHTALAMLALLVASAPALTARGRLSILVSSGLGGTLLRRALLLLILVPLALVWCGATSVDLGWLSLSYAAALTAVALVLTLVVAAIAVARQMNRMDAQLRTQAFTDALTGLWNTRGFLAHADMFLGLTRRNRQTALLVYLDLDGLKAVNDSLGHAAGSQLIAEFGRLLSSTFRSSDVVGRLGGDEFAALCADEGAGNAVERLALAADTWNGEHPNTPPIRYSVGVTTVCHDDQRDLSELIRRADESMYRDKTRRRQSSPGSISILPAQTRRTV